MACQCLLLGVEQTCRAGGQTSEFDPADIRAWWSNEPAHHIPGSHALLCVPIARVDVGDKMLVRLFFERRHSA